MRYRDAVIEDLALITEIYNSTIESRLVTADTELVSVESKLDWFHAHDRVTRPLWVIETEEGDTIGWASFQNFYGRPAYSGTAEISIYLVPEQRGKGFGKTILQHAITQAPSLKVHTLLGFIFAHNAPSIRLFLNAGFSEWAFFPDVAVMDGDNYSLKIFGLKIS